jgi:hypothetical protein
VCIPSIVARQQLGKNPPILARQLLGRNVTVVTNANATIEELLEASFYFRGVLSDPALGWSQSEEVFLKLAVTCKKLRHSDIVDISATEKRFKVRSEVLTTVNKSNL